MNPRIQLLVRNAVCEACKLHTQAEGKDRCVTADGPHDAPVMVVSKTPGGERQRREMEKYLATAGLDVEQVVWASALKCRTWDLEPGKLDMKACKPYLDAEIDNIRPKWILAMGGEALFATTGKSGIMKHRGSTTDHPSGAKVFATISPSMVVRNPGLVGGFVADLRFFTTQVGGGDLEEYVEPYEDQYHEVMTKNDLKAMCAAIMASDYCSFDVETTGYDEHADGAAIVSVAVTTRVGPDDTSACIWALPLAHPESPWNRQWRKAFMAWGQAMRKRQADTARPWRTIAHNGKFDQRWIRQFGVHMRQTFDTLLAAHILDENRPKGLKPLAQHLLGAPPWAISTKDLWLTPISEVLWYNGLDTWHTLRLYDVLQPQLIKQPRLAKLMKYVMMPASEELVDVERRGVWTDWETLFERIAEAKGTLGAVEELLYEWVPTPEEIPPNIKEVNFNPSGFLRWWLFDDLKLPVLERGKSKDNGDPGDPSVREGVLLDLADQHEVPKLLIERTKWYRYVNAFFSPYMEQMDANGRIHSTFKLHGTVTGRLSSGKPDEEKITAKKQIRGVNLQQVPRDSFVRGVFGAPPGSSFVEADYSQVELRVAAFLAREQNMLHHYATGQDLHMAMAMRMTGKPESQVTKEERKKAKPVNFGYLYGMGWRKFVSTAKENYGVVFTEAEAQASRQAFFDMWPDLRAWHARQRRLATKYGRVESPLGRVRHLPDIASRNEGVRAEAERQAINSPVQSFASDMALLSLVMLSREFKRRGMKAHPIGTVHDAVNFEVPDEELAEALPLIKDTMENLPLRRMFGVTLDVPIVADLKVGERWGGALEITPEQIYNWKGQTA